MTLSNLWQFENDPNLEYTEEIYDPVQQTVRIADQVFAGKKKRKGTTHLVKISLQISEIDFLFRISQDVSFVVLGHTCGSNIHT